MRKCIEELQAGLTSGFHTRVPVLPHLRVNIKDNPGKEID